MVTLTDVAALGGREHGLMMVATRRADGTIQASLVNAGVMNHPLTGDPALAFVARGRVKLANLRVRPQITVTVRSGWTWAAVEGVAELIGPDDPHPQVDGERLRILLREVFTAAGGTHDNWPDYDTVMAQERRCVVLVTPTRCYGQPRT